MATCNILEVFPVEIFEHVFSLLSKSRSDIGACRLICRDFHLISSPYLLPSVILADNLDAIHKMQQIIEHPYFSRHVTELIYVPDHYDHEDEYRYETALKAVSEIALPRFGIAETTHPAFDLNPVIWNISGKRNMLSEQFQRFLGRIATSAATSTIYILR